METGVIEVPQRDSSLWFGVGYVYACNFQIAKKKTGHAFPSAHYGRRLTFSSELKRSSANVDPHRHHDKCLGWETPHKARPPSPDSSADFRFESHLVTTNRRSQPRPAYVSMRIPVEKDRLIYLSRQYSAFPTRYLSIFYRISPHSRCMSCITAWINSGRRQWRHDTCHERMPPDTECCSP